VLVLSCASVLALLGMTTTAVATVAVARQRAASVADLAALAAAGRALDGPAAACRRAAVIAERSAAVVVSCGLSGDVADLVVSVRPAGPLGRLGAATGQARAGPVAGGG
jgi:secretion/DNA translocation related TadE-like protein